MHHNDKCAFHEKLSPRDGYRSHKTATRPCSQSTCRSVGTSHKVILLQDHALAEYCTGLVSKEQDKQTISDMPCLPTNDLKGKCHSVCNECPYNVNILEDSDQLRLCSRISGLRTAAGQQRASPNGQIIRCWQVQSCLSTSPESNLIRSCIITSAHCAMHLSDSHGRKTYGHETIAKRIYTSLNLYVHAHKL